MISIALRGVGKRYRLGEKEAYGTLRDSIMRLFSSASRPAESRSEIWAVKDVNLDVRTGEVLGIIGRNGAGKSTLLKLLSRITTPDSGRIEIDGRVGALLEVGTGFHPELTGRENIYMNGSILGMTRREIDRKFDEIVAFSGVEPFLDTPVKRYSSGMRVRLGFAVAAHLEPEILIVDEVLAVGDAEFQRKCLGRMNEAAGEGRTVLFVSHQMEAIQSLCTRVVWMEQGKVMLAGKPDEAIGEYLAHSLETRRATSIADRTDRTGEGRFRVQSIRIDDGLGRPLRTGGSAQFAVTLSGDIADYMPVQPSLRLGIRDNRERLIAMLANELTGDALELHDNMRQLTCRIDKLPLVPGSYIIDFALRVRGALQDKMFLAGSFDVLSGHFFDAGRAEHAGVVHLEQRWTCENAATSNIVSV
jgi:lipopolysaccharide transport system ATP-binding protein